jgi:C1A family cysteine protease
MTGVTMAMNEFGDMTGDEFVANMVGEDNLHPKEPSLSGTNSSANLSGLKLPASIDWTERGAVTPVQYQGAKCADCWAFAAAGAVEGITAIKTGKLIPLSEQQLLDCNGKGTCSGGIAGDAYRYIVRNGGVGSGASYPYTRHMSTCKSVRSVTTISSMSNIASDNEDAMKVQVAQQPISVEIDASKAFQFYGEGVFTGSCTTSVNHAVLIVGYGRNATGTNYWKIKNSWAASWGMNGFALIERGNSGSMGKCGIARFPTYPNY